jgi:hypothetical protein
MPKGTGCALEVGLYCCGDFSIPPDAKFSSVDWIGWLQRLSLTMLEQKKLLVSARRPSLQGISAFETGRNLMTTFSRTTVQPILARALAAISEAPGHC